jgi:hypothetical protein
MAPKALDVGAQLIDGALGVVIVKVHIGNRGEVNLGALELADGGPHDLAPLTRGSLIGELDDGVAHGLKLGQRV